MGRGCGKVGVYIKWRIWGRMEFGLMVEYDIPEKIGRNVVDLKVGFSRV
jgi:hypothetical protein